ILSSMEGVDRFHWNLARGFFAIPCACATFGIVGNSIIFLTTIGTRTLRNTYNILIAICALADVFHQFGTLVQVPFLFDYFLIIDSKLCGIILILPEMGIGVGCGCILSIGLDRMISVVFSTRYRKFDKHYYHGILGSLIVSYCLFLAYLMIEYYRPRLVLCEVMAPYADEGIMWFASANFLINATSVCIYFVMWLGLRSHADSKGMRRIIKSLFIVVVVDVSGWVLTPGLIELSQHVDWEPQQKFVWAYFCIIFVNLGISAKLVIYYSTRFENFTQTEQHRLIFSSEYRAALKSFRFRKSSLSRTSVVETRTITIVSTR
ncbi:hypothetical protein PRIPAC_76905, partial [Pristionchus pacificus]|uniref:G protein-coupled receptor n=1 Tax=Pristionchus pacificus TaxID=54126 RepID=A0A2A6CLV5_PRIPA